MLNKFKVTIIFLLISLTVANAQFKNIKLDEQGADGFVCEPSIAINPKDPLNIVAASVLNNIYVTKDGGATWVKKKMESPFGVFGDPALIASPGGTFYFFHLSDPTHGKGGYDSEKLDRMVVQSSSDGGETWSEGESIGLNHPKDQDKEWPAIDSKGNLYLAWTQFDKYGDPDPNCHSNILLSTSRNGRKWSDPVQISQTPGDCLDDDNTAEGAVPAIASDGKIFIVWANQEKIFMDRSYDGGDTWLNNDIAIMQQPGGWDLKIPGHDRCNGMPVLKIDNSKGKYKGGLNLVWGDLSNGVNDSDVWFMHSSNNGDNWSSPIKVSNDGPGKHQYLPWMTIDQTTGFIYIVYYDRRNYNDTQTDVYLAYSENGGINFKNVRISETPFTPTDTNFFGDYTNISAHKGIITPIWARMDNGKTSVWTTVIKHADLAASK